MRFAIHPVAGRLPGHMNVLLAEAKVPYDIVHGDGRDQRDFPETDVVMVIGANDIVNPSARDDSVEPDLRHAGARGVEGARWSMIKRSMASGYAGVDNPLFYKDNTAMLFGDARSSVQKLLAALREKSA